MDFSTATRKTQRYSVCSHRFDEQRVHLARVTNDVSELITDAEALYDDLRLGDGGQ